MQILNIFLSSLVYITLTEIEVKPTAFNKSRFSSLNIFLDYFQHEACAYTAINLLNVRANNVREEK